MSQDVHIEVRLHAEFSPVQPTVEELELISALLPDLLLLMQQLEDAGED